MQNCKKKTNGLNPSYISSLATSLDIQHSSHRIKNVSTLHQPETSLLYAREYYDITVKQYTTFGCTPYSQNKAECVCSGPRQVSTSTRITNVRRESCVCLQWRAISNDIVTRFHFVRRATRRIII